MPVMLTAAKRMLRCDAMPFDKPLVWYAQRSIIQYVKAGSERDPILTRCQTFVEKFSVGKLPMQVIRPLHFILSLVPVDDILR